MLEGVTMTVNLINDAGDIVYNDATLDNYDTIAEELSFQRQEPITAITADEEFLEEFGR